MRRRDEGLPVDIAARDRAGAEVYQRYQDTALAEPVVAAAMSFGLTDRYTWLEEDYLRADGKPRRPLPFDTEMQPKPAIVFSRDSNDTLTRDQRYEWSASLKRQSE